MIVYIYVCVYLCIYIYIYLSLSLLVLGVRGVLRPPGIKPVGFCQAFRGE